MKALRLDIFVLLALAFAVPAKAAPLSGIKTVGPTGDYTSIKAAIADIQALTLGGALVLELQAAYVSTVETFPLTFSNLTTTATNTLTLRPQTGATALSISSSNTTAATVDLNGAQFVSVDGRPGGTGTAKQLTIANTATSGVALRFINEASSNSVRYITLQGVNTSVSSGTVVFSTTTGANGNDNNTIDNCDIRDGATTPTNGIYALGTSTTAAKNNSGNTVSNCNIFNFYRSTAVDAAGVRIESGNNNWALTGNSFYQTASRAGVAAIVRAIYLSDTSDISHTITGNFIGGGASSAGGTAWTSTGTSAAYVFVGIWLRVGNNTATSVQGNTIKNFSWSSSSNATTQPGVWAGIYVETGAADIGTGTGNTIGSGTGTGSISTITAGNGGTTFGIGSVSSLPVSISNNIIGSISASGTNTGIAASITGIQTSQGTNTISGNTVGSTTTANSLNASTSPGGGGQQVTGIESANGGSAHDATITGNTVANLINKSTQTNAQIRGIVTSVGVNVIASNTVRNLSSPSQSTGLSVVGISQTSSAAGQTVSQNVIHSLSNTANAAIIPAPDAAVKVAGIDYDGGISGTNIIARNFVHSLSVDSGNASAEVSGLRFEAGCTFTAQNNMVRVGLDANGASIASSATVRGIYDIGASLPRNFVHNSVYVGGTVTSGAANTFAFSSSSQSNSRDFRNNIFMNARSNNGGTGKHYAMTNGSVAVPSPGLTSDYNILYVTGNGGVLFLFNGNNYTTLDGWQAGTGQDLSSAAADPRFVNAIGTAATVDLHLQASNPAEGHGAPIASVTDDFDGQTRSTLTPVDIGADAGTFTYDPPPTISYPLLSNGTTANRVLTSWASIADNNSVATGANAPRLYYKKSTDADVFGGNTSADNGWKYVTGADSGGGSYSFTIDYSNIQGGVVTVGETIQYFVVAQDAANNLSSLPSTAGASANPPVQHINAKPGTGVNSYSILAPLSGTVTVGPSGSYPSLSGSSGLFAAVNASALTGNLTVNITGNTTEDGSVTLNATNANVYPNGFTLTIQPDSATMRTVSGSISLSSLITLNGVNRVTIDGRFGGSGRYLTFRNTSTGSFASSIAFINDASNNTISNCVLEGASTNTGVVAFRTGSVTGNDNNTVTGNQIRDRSDASGVPISLVSSGGTSDWVANSDNTISNNDMFNFTGWGVGVGSGSKSWSITGNTIYQTAARTTQLEGISFSGLGSNTIRGNIVRDMTTSVDAFGIDIPGQAGNTIIAGNRIWNLGNRSGAISRIRGINFAPSASQSVTVANNMIVLSSSGATNQNLSGIHNLGAAGSTTVTAFNSVLITGTGSGGRDTWAFRNQGNSTATVMNNIFLNLRTGGGSHFAANYSTASTGALTMDYNVYAGTGLSTAANFFDSSDGSGLSGTPISYAQWQTNVPGDTHSYAGNPGGNYTSATFVDATTADLHVVLESSPLLANTGTPVAGLTADYDGQTRGLVAPDIGADEFDFANAGLSGLTLSSGSLNPPFSPNTLNYTVTVPNATNSLTTSLTKSDPNANATVNGGSPSSPVTLNVGANTISINVISQDGTTSKTYVFTATRLTAADSWRQQQFGTASNTGNAADTSDPNGNGISNLMEYALNGDPSGNTVGISILPAASANGANHLQMAFTRYLDRNDITLTVQGSDTLGGTWTDLAQSVNGASFAVLASGATVSETGTGNTRAVSVGDLYQISDPVHPRRFLRLQVARP